MEKNIGGGYVYTESASSASYADEGFSVESLNDVEVTNPENGQVLAYDSSSEKWVNSEAGGGASTLAGLTDVDISNPADGQTLVYDATSEKWVNGAGGVLVVHATEADDVLTLDKTWQEIFDADVISIVWLERATIKSYLICETVLSVGSGDAVSYIVQTSKDSGTSYEFIANSASGYPDCQLD